MSTSRGYARPQRRRVTTAIAATCLAVLATPGVAPGIAQEWPSKPIKLVVPFSPGGATDVVSRVIADKLSGELRQPVTIDNRPGAGGNIGAVVVAKAAADGYTMFVAGSPGFTNAAALTKDPGFDAEKDFVPVAMIATQSVLLTLHQSVPANTLAELVAYARDMTAKVEEWRNKLVETYRCGTQHASLDELLKDRGVDAVGLFTPAPDHVKHAVACMKAGKHVLSAVPAAMTLEECALLRDTVKRTGMTYMMAETSYYQQLSITARQMSSTS